MRRQPSESSFLLSNLRSKLSVFIREADYENLFTSLERFSDVLKEKKVCLLRADYKA